jgi:hypothetical protein
MLGIILGAAVVKIFSFRTEFSIEIWTTRDTLFLESSYMQKLLQDCESEEYELFSEAHKDKVNYWGKMVRKITIFPYFGSKEIQDELEGNYEGLVENNKIMDEKINKCKGT